MNKLYYLAPGIIPSSVCNSIIERGLALPSQDASIGFDQDHVDNNYRVSCIRWFYGPDIPDIVNLINYHTSLANREHFGFDISMGPFEFQFTEYHSNNHGKYDWHHDVWWENPRAHDRKLSFILQLCDSNEYEGGNLEFNIPGCDYDPLRFKPRGSILIFPSFFTHRVTPVTRGTRYSLVSWIDGPKFR